MSPITPKSDSGRYIIQAADPRQLAEFLDEIGKDKDMELLDTIGPAGQPHTAVVAMSQEKANSLEQRFRTSNQQLKIEPDRPLSLFGAAGNE
jgi:hypothetical protein